MKTSIIRDNVRAEYLRKKDNISSAYDMYADTDSIKVMSHTIKETEADTEYGKKEKDLL